MDGPSTIAPGAVHDARLVALSSHLLGASSVDGHLRLLNPAWGASLGWTDEELWTKRFLDLVPAGDRAAVGRAIDGLVPDGPVAEFTCRLLHADGSDSWVQFRAQAGPDDGCCYLAGKDVSDRKRLEEQLLRSTAELQEFAYVASHDLSEPLRMVTAYLELLQRRYGGQLDDTADEFIGFAVGGAVRLKALIDDLLAYSRAATLELHPGRVDLAPLLDKVVRDLDGPIGEAGATIERVTPHAAAHADGRQLEQLLEQLIANAVTFRAPDRPPVVTISSEVDGVGVRIDVADNGIGIDPAHQDRIFKVFGRLHGRDEYDGTGIGLALCRRIAERHGGRLDVDSRPGAGSTFHVWLPGHG
jgi:PAS domain S-box-containing protein